MIFMAETEACDGCKVRVTRRSLEVFQEGNRELWLCRDCVAARLAAETRHRSPAPGRVRCLWHEEQQGVPFPCGHVCCESCVIVIGGCCKGCCRSGVAKNAGGSSEGGER